MIKSVMMMMVTIRWWSWRHQTWFLLSAEGRRDRWRWLTDWVCCILLFPFLVTFIFYLHSYSRLLFLFFVFLLSLTAEMLFFLLGYLLKYVFFLVFFYYLLVKCDYIVNYLVLRIRIYVASFWFEYYTCLQDIVSYFISNWLLADCQIWLFYFHWTDQGRISIFRLIHLCYFKRIGLWRSTKHTIYIFSGSCYDRINSFLNSIGGDVLWPDGQIGHW